MKATGIVRRIDDLGRVVIPKEIRRTLRIREGDPLEIFTDREGEIILKKYSPIGELSAFAKEYAESMALTTGHIVCISDRDQIIAVAGGGKKDYMGKSISKKLEQAINERENVIAIAGEKEYVDITEDDAEESFSEVITPIICQGDAIGSVIVLNNKEAKVKMTELEQKLAGCAAMFLGRQMEQ
jgi:AbrB family transcriptional regulator (stage V sporulation protein T)